MMNQLIQETQETFFSYLFRVKDGCVTIAEKLRKDNVGEALQLLAQFVEGASWLLQVVHLMQKNGFAFSVSMEGLNEYLYEINEGLEIQDYVLVADLFEYEIAPFIDNMIEGQFVQCNDVEGN